MYLARQGYTVLAGVRKDADGEVLSQAARAAGTGGNLQPILIDVADAESIRLAAVKVAELSGAQGLCGLINNAGIVVVGPVEFVELNEWRRQFEVNVFGQIAVTQTMLPLLRQHVSQRGAGSARIVTIGSIAGRITQPILAPYCASKHAIEAINDAMRFELRSQGIEVSLIEPGAIKSEIWRKAEETAASAPTDSPARKLYGKVIDAISETAKKSASNAISADRVAEAVHRCLTRRRPPTRIVIGRDARAAAVLKRLVPDRWLDAILTRVFGLKD